VKYTSSSSILETSTVQNTITTQQEKKIKYHTHACLILKAKNIALTMSSFGITLAMLNEDITFLAQIDSTNPKARRSSEWRRRLKDMEFDFDQMTQVFTNFIQYQTLANTTALFSGNSSDRITNNYFLHYPPNQLSVRSSCVSRNCNFLTNRTIRSTHMR